MDDDHTSSRHCRDRRWSTGCSRLKKSDNPVQSLILSIKRLLYRLLGLPHPLTPPIRPSSIEVAKLCALTCVRIDMLVPCSVQLIRSILQYACIRYRLINKQRSKRFNGWLSYVMTYKMCLCVIIKLNKVLFQILHDCFTGLAFWRCTSF